MVHGYHQGMHEDHPFKTAVLTIIYRIVDMHSHLAVDSSPGLRGSSDGNSFHGPVLPVSKGTHLHLLHVD